VGSFQSSIGVKGKNKKSKSSQGRINKLSQIRKSSQIGDNGYINVVRKITMPTSSSVADAECRCRATCDMRCLSYLALESRDNVIPQSLMSCKRGFWISSSPHSSPASGNRCCTRSRLPATQPTTDSYDVPSRISPCFGGQ
jgi:hypothetical protein